MNDSDIRRIASSKPDQTYVLLLADFAHSQYSVKLMQSQMQNLMRSIAQLQAGLSNVQNLEQDLRKQLKIPASYDPHLELQPRIASAPIE